jgi:hypothetical protein
MMKTFFAAGFLGDVEARQTMANSVMQLITWLQTNAAADLSNTWIASWARLPALYPIAQSYLLCMGYTASSNKEKLGQKAPSAMPNRCHLSLGEKCRHRRIVTML